MSRKGGKSKQSDGNTTEQQKVEIEASISSMLSRNPNLQIVSAKIPKAKKITIYTTDTNSQPTMLEDEICQDEICQDLIKEEKSSSQPSRSIKRINVVQLMSEKEEVLPELDDVEDLDESVNFEEDSEIVLMMEGDDYEYEFDSETEIMQSEREISPPVRKRPRLVTNSSLENDVTATDTEITSKDAVKKTTKKYTIKDINCSVCCKNLDPERLSSFKDVFEDCTARYSSPYKHVLNSILGEEIDEISLSSLLCQRCENLIDKIDELKHQLISSTEILRDLFELGQKALEEDFLDGRDEADAFLDTKVEKKITNLMGNPEFYAKVIDYNTGGFNSMAKATDFQAQIVSRHLVEINKNAANMDSTESEMVTLMFDLSTGAMVPTKLEKPPSIPETQIDRSRPVLYCTEAEWTSTMKVGRGDRYLTTSSNLDNLDLVLMIGHNFTHRILLSRNVMLEFGRQVPAAVGSSFLCVDCDAGFSRLNVLVAHIQGTHEGNLKHDAVNMKVKLDSPLRHLGIQSQLDCRTGEKPTLEKPFQCENCDKCFSGYSNMMSHIDHFHGWTRPCNVTDCSFSFTSIHDFVTHHVQHRNASFVIPNDPSERNVVLCTCPICGKQSNGVNKHWEHTFIHDKNPRFKCPICPRRVNKVQNLKDHIKRHMGSEQKTKECEVCNKKFYDSDIYRHMKTVHGTVEDKFVCSVCSKGFHALYKLKHHQELHVDKDLWTFKCDDCSSAFPSQSRLNHHKKVVHEQVPSLCPECGKNFQNKFNLTHHIKNVHGDELARFQCTDCALKVTTLFAARKHYRLLHKDKPFSCNLCKKVFVKEGSLHAHLNKFHSEVSENSADNEEKNEYPCVFCGKMYNKPVSRLRHTRFAHLVESIDVSNIQDEVQVIGDHIAEFSKDSGQIIALHSIP